MAYKLNLNRVEMPKQSPEKRKGNFQEVALGYSPEQAVEEANRCIQCKKPKCVEGCPVGVDIPEFILALREGDMPGAALSLKRKNSLPGSAGGSVPRRCSARAAAS